MSPIGALDSANALSDLEIVRQVLDGDTSRFELIMRRYNRRLYRIARGLLRRGRGAGRLSARL